MTINPMGGHVNPPHKFTHRVDVLGLHEMIQACGDQGSPARLAVSTLLRAVTDGLGTDRAQDCFLCLSPIVQGPDPNALAGMATLTVDTKCQREAFGGRGDTAAVAICKTCFESDGLVQAVIDAFRRDVQF
jgi:hypothetical protein